MWFLDTLLALATLGLAMVLPMVYLVPYVAPARMWLFPVMALAVPALYVLAAVLACYWIVRWRLVRAGLLLLSGYISSPGICNAGSDLNSYFLKSGCPSTTSITFLNMSVSLSLNSSISKRPI